MVTGLLGQILATYGTKINSFLLDTSNDHGLEQLLDEPTRNNHSMDLVLSTYLEIICDVTVVPGMSDHGILLSQ